MLYQSLFKTSHVTRRPSLQRLSAIQVQLLSLCMGKHQNWLYQCRGRPIYRLIFVIFLYIGIGQYPCLVAPIESQARPRAAPCYWCGGRAAACEGPQAKTFGIFSPGR